MDHSGAHAADVDAGFERVCLRLSCCAVCYAVLTGVVVKGLYTSVLLALHITANLSPSQYALWRNSQSDVLGFCQRHGIQTVLKCNVFDRYDTAAFEAYVALFFSSRGLFFLHPLTCRTPCPPQCRCLRVQALLARPFCSVSRAGHLCCDANVASAPSSGARAAGHHPTDARPQFRFSATTALRRHTARRD